MPTVTHDNQEAMLGLRIMTQLQRQQKSVYWLAKHAGLPVKTVQRICKGEGKQPSFWTMVAIARVLGVSMDALAGTLEAMSPAAPSQETDQAAPPTQKRQRTRKAAPVA
jgi:DNA-binding phage protein